MKFPKATANNSNYLSDGIYPTQVTDSGKFSERRILPSLVAWGDEHEARAKALANEVKETAISLGALSDTNSGDAILSIWAHGSQDSFADYTERQIADRIAAYKKAGGKKMTTVEFITCDAQHAQDRNYNAFAKRVKTILKKGHSIDLTVKALPVSTLGKDSASILWADTTDNSWLYGTAYSADILKNDINSVASGSGSLVDIGLSLVRGNKGKYTVNYGILNSLRNSLATVK